MKTDTNFRQILAIFFKVCFFISQDLHFFLQKKFCGESNLYWMFLKNIFMNVPPNAMKYFILYSQLIFMNELAEVPMRCMGKCIQELTCGFCMNIGIWEPRASHPFAYFLSKSINLSKKQPQNAIFYTSEVIKSKKSNNFSKQRDFLLAFF